MNLLVGVGSHVVLHTHRGTKRRIWPHELLGAKMRARPSVWAEMDNHDLDPDHDDVRPLTRADVLSTTEVAELLGIPRSTVHELARRGDLPARRVGRRWLFLRKRIAAALAPLDEPHAWRPPSRFSPDQINGASRRTPRR